MKTFRCLFLLFSGVLLLSLISIPNAAASLVNGSFEIAKAGISLPPINTFRTSIGDSIRGWVVEWGNVDWVGAGYWNSSQGNYSVDMDGTTPGKISQSFDTVPGGKYTVSFDLSGNPWGGAVQPLQVSILDSGNASLFSGQYNNDNPYSTISVSVPGFTGMIWNSKSFEFTATSDLTKIAFQSLTPGYYGPAIDNINVEVVPIPSGLLLLGSGLAALIAYKRKHRS
jgi:choice-of-anchor C domain-containing protein